MTPAQPRAAITLCVCAAAAMFEGFDTQSMGVAAPMLFREFGIAPGQGGFIFSAATLGLFVGAAVGGRLADYMERRRALAASLLLFGVCSLLTAAVHGAQWLIFVRVLTGLGLGGAMPNFIAMSTEACQPQRRLSVVTLVMAALPFGGALAGLIALGDRLGWGWRPIFIVGGTAPILLALPLLVSRRAPAAAGTVAPAATVRVSPTSTVLWEMDRATTTWLLWTAFFFTQLVLLLMLNWLPSLIVGSGFSRTEASVASIAFNLAGSAGAALLGRLHAGTRRRLWVLITYGGIAVALVALAGVAMFGHEFVIALFGSAFAGIFIIGAQLILFALAPLYYRSADRGTGVGASVAIGRLGSVVGPLFAASLLAAGGHATTVLAGIVPFVLVAGAAAFALTWRPQSGD